MSGELGKQLRMSFYPTYYPTLKGEKKPDTVTPYHVELSSVGAAGLEPATSCSRSRRATGLRYAPFSTTFKVVAPLACW